MNRTMPQANEPAQAGNSQPEPRTKAKPAEQPPKRVTLALLDEYSEQKIRGYNPYDTRSARPKGDVWGRKPKRD
jgi:hypothetical protein